MKKRPIFYDVETTGLQPDKDRIVEIAAFDPLENRQFVQLVNPGCKIPKEATAIHQISNEMVADQPDFSHVGKLFGEFCAGEVILVAHNNDNFDRHFLNHEFKRHQLPDLNWVFFDSLKWARRYRPDLPRHTLQFLREIYSISANQAHRALDDVIILHSVFCKMVDDLTIEMAHSLLYGEREVTHMPFGKYQGKPLDQLPDNYVRWLASSGALEKEENRSLKSHLIKRGLLPAESLQGV